MESLWNNNSSLQCPSCPYTHSLPLSLKEGCCALEIQFQASENNYDSQKPSEGESFKRQIQECSPLSHHVTSAKISPRSSHELALNPKHFSGKDKPLGISCCTSTTRCVCPQSPGEGLQGCQHLGRPHPPSSSLLTGGSQGTPEMGSSLA